MTAVETDRVVPGMIARQLAKAHFRDYNDSHEEDVTTVEGGANVVTSLMVDQPEFPPGPFGSSGLLHAPVLDLDVAHVYVESSTPGHAHLYLDHPVPQGAYFRLLDALAECGLLEKGYVNASQQRGYTSVRLPWIRKADDDAPDNLDPKHFHGCPTPTGAPFDCDYCQERTRSMNQEVRF